MGKYNKFIYSKLRKKDSSYYEYLKLDKHYLTKTIRRKVIGGAGILFYYKHNIYDNNNTAFFSTELKKVSKIENYIIVLEDNEGNIEIPFGRYEEMDKFIFPNSSGKGYDHNSFNNSNSDILKTSLNTAVRETKEECCNSDPNLSLKIDQLISIDSKKLYFNIDVGQKHRKGVPKRAQITFMKELSVDDLNIFIDCSNKLEEDYNNLHIDFSSLSIELDEVKKEEIKRYKKIYLMNIDEIDYKNGTGKVVDINKMKNNNDNDTNYLFETKIIRSYHLMLIKKLIL